MAQTPLDLKAAWAKFLAGLLRVLSMAKFWVMIGADLTAYSQLAAGGITGAQFVGVVAGGAVALILAIAHEDAAEKSASTINLQSADLAPLVSPADASKS